MEILTISTHRGYTITRARKDLRLSLMTNIMVLKSENGALEQELEFSTGLKTMKQELVREKCDWCNNSSKVGIHYIENEQVIDKYLCNGCFNEKKNKRGRKKST